MSLKLNGASSGHVILDAKANAGSYTLTLPSAGNGELVAADSSGNITISNGNLIVGTAGKGIDFSAASGSNAGSSSALLDDYEEGSWTPTWNNVTTTTASSIWRYTKVGNLVTVWGRFVCNTTTNNAAHSVWISNLPFTTTAHLTNNFSEYTSAVSTHNVNTDGQNITTFVGANATNMEFFHLGDSVSWDNLRSSDIAASNAMLITQTYVAA